MASNLRRCAQLRRFVTSGPQPQSVLAELGLRAGDAASLRGSQAPLQAAFLGDQRRSATASATAEAPKGNGQQRQAKAPPGAAGSSPSFAASGSEGPRRGSDGSSESTAEASAAGSGGDAGTGGASGSDEQPGGKGAGAGFGGADARRRAEEAKLKAAGWATQAQRLIRAVREEVTAVMLPETAGSSATRRRAGGETAGVAAAAGGPAEIMVVAQPQTVFEKGWERLRGQYGGSPLFKRLEALGAGLGDNPAVRKSREMKEDLKERWETSDSPFVHRIQDMSDSMFAETEMAKAFREVQARDPSFDMVSFLQRLRSDVPTIVGAYLGGRADVLVEHCAPQMVEQLTAIIRAQHSQGLFADATLLDVSEVELADLKFLENDPVIVVQFNCQQINCTRDKFGNVVEGAPDDLQRVYYYWAIQQDAAGSVGMDGKHHPPRWQLREMLVRGMHALIG